MSQLDNKILSNTNSCTKEPLIDIWSTESAIATAKSIANTIIADVEKERQQRVFAKESAMTDANAIINAYTAQPQQQQVTNEQEILNACMAQPQPQQQQSTDEKKILNDWATDDVKQPLLRKFTNIDVNAWSAADRAILVNSCIAYQKDVKAKKDSSTLVFADVTWIIATSLVTTFAIFAFAIAMIVPRSRDG
jgi:hypothetical protein